MGHLTLPPTLLPTYEFFATNKSKKDALSLDINGFCNFLSKWVVYQFLPVLGNFGQLCKCGGTHGGPGEPIFDVFPPTHIIPCLPYHGQFNLSISSDSTTLLTWYPYELLPEKVTFHSLTLPTLIAPLQWFPTEQKFAHGHI